MLIKLLIQKSFALPCSLVLSQNPSISMYFLFILFLLRFRQFIIIFWNEGIFSVWIWNPSLLHLLFRMHFEFLWEIYDVRNLWTIIIYNGCLTISINNNRFSNALNTGSPTHNRLWVVKLRIGFSLFILSGTATSPFWNILLK